MPLGRGTGQLANASMEHTASNSTALACTRTTESVRANSFRHQPVAQTRIVPFSTRRIITAVGTLEEGLTNAVEVADVVGRAEEELVQRSPIERRAKWHPQKQSLPLRWR